MKLKNLLTIVFAGLALTSQAQSGFVSAGKDVSTEDGAVSFSVGQVVYNSYETANGDVSLTQGLQQPYTISSEPIPEAIKEIKSIQLSAYPNPTSDILNLSIAGVECKGLSYVISDVNARIQMTGDINNENTQIEVAQLLAGVYFVEVRKNNDIVRAFKVVKQ